MKAFGKYISRYFAAFIIFIFFLLLANLLVFGLTFYKVVFGEYGPSSPANMLETVNADASIYGISQETALELDSHQIWAMCLDPEGNRVWSVSLPEEIPEHFTVQEVAAFSRGYLLDYPVFVRVADYGLLVLGYPQGSFMKITGNYFPLQTVKLLPLFVAGVLTMDIVLLFCAYCLSRQRIMKSTAPIMASIKDLSSGKPVDLSVRGELSEVADSVNQASHILSRQNEARANWISGVSHDIRTPLSMIMGYAQRIAGDNTASDHVRQEAEIIQGQSAVIRDLVQDLNLVSQLEYEMQPLHKKPVRLSKLLRSCAAELLNTGLPERYSIEVEIDPAAEAMTLDCDDRLMIRAINNLVQNSIRHNPDGCDIVLSLACASEGISLSVSDNGAGLSNEKLKELREKPHYMESTDDRLDLRHGLGLILVRQIVEAHKGTIVIDGEEQKGCKAALVFPNG